MHPGAMFRLVRRSMVVLSLALFLFPESSPAQHASPTWSKQGFFSLPDDQAGADRRQEYLFPASTVSDGAESASRDRTPLTVSNIFIVVTLLDTGAGSLRAAIASANASPGPDQIDFGVTGSIALRSPLPAITDPVVINGPYPPAVELNGSLAGDANGLVITAGNSTVRGLVINRFQSPGDAYGFGIVLDVNGGNVIQGNYIGTNMAGTAALTNSGSGVAVFGNSTHNTIGGTTPQQRNVLSGNYTGVQCTGNAGHNRILGNFIGLGTNGTTAIGNTVNGIFLNAADDTIGGVEPGARNTISGNAAPGIWIGYAASRTVVLGNFIGTDTAGALDRGNVQQGIYLDGALDCVIGAAVSGGRNLISGNNFPGIYVTGATPPGGSGNVFVNNFIGTNAAGNAAIPNSKGIILDNAPRNVIGGPTVAEGNIISGNTSYGIEVRNAGATGNVIMGNYIGTDITGTSNRGNGSHGVVLNSSRDSVTLNVIAFNNGAGVYDSSGTGNLIVRNSIFSNAGRGIDLAPTGLAVNDSLDLDGGPNESQNFPIIDSMKVDSTGVMVYGRYSGKPNGVYTLDFYENSTYDPSHFGEGEMWLGQMGGATFGSGAFSFAHHLDQLVPDTAVWITATARDTGGNTSEFSQAVSLIDADRDGILDSWETPGWGMDPNSDGVIDLDLAALGASPTQMDIFVEVDAMTGMAPTAATLGLVSDAFRLMPSKPIYLHSIISDTLLPPAPWLTNWWQNFAAMKEIYFGTESERASPNAGWILATKRQVFRYCIFAFDYTSTASSGIAEAIGSDDFMVTLGSWGTQGGTEPQKASTYMHELGHTLGLRHGGSDNVQYKPNYISVMNYAWQMPYKWTSHWFLSYSNEALPDLDEHTLDEFSGLGVPSWTVLPVLGVPYSGPGGSALYTNLEPGRAVDWDSSGSFALGGPVSANINAYVTKDTSLEPLTGHEDWSKLILNFRTTPAYTPPGGSARLSVSSQIVDDDELDYETFLKLDSLPPPRPFGLFNMDGELDSSAVLLASNAGIYLYGRYASGQLYIATNAAPSLGKDVYVIVSDARNPVRSAPLPKGGNTAAWGAYLVNRSSDNSSEWRDTADVLKTNITVDTAGTILEGVIDVELLFRGEPRDIFLAVGAYDADSSGTLTAQVPAGNGDTDIDPTELYRYGIALPPGGPFKQQGPKLVGTGAVGTSFQGWTVSLSADGNTALVGGNPDDANTGAAWVFTRTGDGWSQDGGKLLGGGAVGKANFGHSVALSAEGNTAVLGGFTDSSSRGAAWIFVRSGGAWIQQGNKLVGSGFQQSSSQGASVGISGDGNTVIVGGYGDDGGKGAAWIFTRSDTTWSQQGSKLVGTGAVGNAYQGVAVALSGDGNTAIVGGYNDDATKGAVWIFTRNAGVWTQQGEKLVAAGAFVGQRHGGAVALSADGNTAVVGQENNGPGGAWIFTRTGDAWTQTDGVLLGADAVGSAQQGGSVSISGDGQTVVVGGFTDDNFAGAAWIFTRSGDTWSQEGTKLVGTGAATTGITTQGHSVSISADGATILSGASNDSSSLGATWVFTREPEPAVEVVELTATLISGSRVRLDWTTLSEKDNYGFQVQRSPVGPGNFETLPNSFVPGNGTTSDTNRYSFIDSSTGVGQWLFRLRQIAFNWKSSYGDPVNVEVLTGVDDEGVPTRFSLSQNYPNPFNPTTTLSFVVPQASLVALQVYDMLGRKVATLVDERKEPGEYFVTFDVLGLASGVYFYRLEAREPGTSRVIFLKSEKMMIVK